MEIQTQPRKALPVREIIPQASPVVTNSLERLMVKIALAVEFMAIAIQCLGNPVKALSTIRKMRKKYKKVFGEALLTKIARVDGRYYWRAGAAGFPSKAAWTMRQNEINRFAHFKPASGLRSVIFGITKKCPLSCEHCYEWDNLNQKESLSTDDLVRIMHKYQDYGTTQMVFSGGEPMLRIQDIFTLLQKAKTGTDFWIVTSGWKLNADRAQDFKKAGLTGIFVSLDHHLAEKHDRFRGFQGAYNMAVNAAIQAKKAKLVSALSLCATKEYVTEKNLHAFMELAKKLGVTFVQIFEPKAVGRYKGKNVELSSHQIGLLENLYLEYNSGSVYKDYPIVNYLGYHQRKLGCFGSGDYFFYIDTDGDAHSCPFCSGKVCNTLAVSAPDTVSLLKQSGCHAFH